MGVERGKQRPETKLWALQVDLIKGNQPKNLRQRIRVGRERGEDQVKKDFPERHNEQDEGWEQRAGFGVGMSAGTQLVPSVDWRVEARLEIGRGSGPRDCRQPFGGVLP